MTERVVDTSVRPKTVRALQTAGAPQERRLDENFKTYLDQQWNKKPEAVLKLFQTRPDIRDWYEGRTR